MTLEAFRNKKIKLIKQLFQLDFGIVSTLYPVFTTNEQLNSKYLQYQLNEGSEFRRFSLLQKQGGSRTYMYLNKLQNMILNIPKLEEQQKIGSFFQQLDETIALHQRKLDLLKEQKKGFLQKMFV
nr:restriction endonuclease subunit S [Lactococcus cremoris]